MATRNNRDHTRAHSITAYSRHIYANDATSNQLGAGCFQAIKTSAGIKTATFQPERVCISELF